MQNVRSKIRLITYARIAHGLNLELSRFQRDDDLLVYSIFSAQYGAVDSYQMDREADGQYEELHLEASR